MLSFYLDFRLIIIRQWKTDDLTDFHVYFLLLFLWEARSSKIREREISKFCFILYKILANRCREIHEQGANVDTFLFFPGNIKWSDINLKHSFEFLSKGPGTMSFLGEEQLNSYFIVFLSKSLKYWSHCDHRKSLSELNKLGDR